VASSANAAGLWQSYLAVILASFLWGSLYPAGKPAVAAVGPMQVAFCRVALAFVTLSLVVILRGGAPTLVAQLRGRWLGILALSLVSFSVSSVIGMLSLGLLPASINGLLNNTHPLWVAIGTAALLAPRRPAVLIGGSIVALVGVGLVLFPDLSFSVLGGPNALNPLGVGLSLIGSLVIAASTVTGRQVMRKGDPIAISALASGAAVPVLVALMQADGGFAPIFAASLTIKLLLLYLGVGCTALNFTLWFYGLQRLPAAQASAFQFLIPPIAVALSSIALGEVISLGVIVGGGLILCGLIATQAAGTR
jgi:drug/metabolite transporter (DMT)-like permease